MEVTKIKPEELNLPEGPAKIPQIDWGQDFENFDKDHKIRYLKRLCSALNHAADTIQNERNDALKKIGELLRQLENAEKSVEIQKDIMHRAITANNEEKQQMIQRLQELEAEVKAQDDIIKRFTDGYKHKLGN